MAKKRPIECQIHNPDTDPEQQSQMTTRGRIHTDPIRNSGPAPTSNYFILPDNFLCLLVFLQFITVCARVSDINYGTFYSIFLTIISIC